MKIETHDDNWIQDFKEEARTLMSILPEEEVLEFHHIGSTAIANMPARPIIDVGVMIESFDSAKENVISILESKGYTYHWEDGHLPGYMSFEKKGEDGITSHIISMAEEEHEFWDRLYFRDYLRKYPSEAKKYCELKQELLTKYENDLLSYEEGKDQYVKIITSKAKKEIEIF
jgi:GrpB-like predicted nucleotidyltransferase (UPF0157 family)